MTYKDIKTYKHKDLEPFPNLSRSSIACVRLFPCVSPQVCCVSWHRNGHCRSLMVLWIIFFWRVQPWHCHSLLTEDSIFFFQIKPLCHKDAMHPKAFRRKTPPQHLTSTLILHRFCVPLSVFNAPTISARSSVLYLVWRSPTIRWWFPN